MGDNPAENPIENVLGLLPHPIALIPLRWENVIYNLRDDIRNGQSLVRYDLESKDEKQERCHGRQLLCIYSGKATQILCFLPVFKGL